MDDLLATLIITLVPKSDLVNREEYLIRNSTNFPVVLMLENDNQENRGME